MTASSATQFPGSLLFAHPAEWRSRQLGLLREHLAAASRSALYKDLEIERLATIEEIESLLLELPFTTKDQLASAGRSAWGCSNGDIREIVTTSGTAGSPLDVPLTSTDLGRLRRNETSALALAGIGEGDLVLLNVGMDRQFVAGLAYWLGAQALGASCIRLGPHAHPTLLRQALKRYRQQEQRAFVITVPSFLADAQTPEIPLTAIVAIGEPIRSPEFPCSYNSLGDRLHGLFHCPILSTYATTETCSTFAESPACKGGHLNPEMAVLELLEEDGTPTPAGSAGEITLTPLGVTGLPLLRFRTGDMAMLHSDPCPCGRTTPRLGPIVGRKQQLLKVRGTSLYPAAILEAVRSLAVIADCCILAERETTLSDRLTLHVVLVDAVQPAAVQGQIESHLRSVLRVTPAVQFVTPEALRTLQTSMGSRKLSRFIDRR